MVSEGVDIPRLRVGVYATNTVTELFFRQAVGRLVRFSAGLGRQAAYMFIPDDVRLRTFGTAIAEQRRHCLRKESKGHEFDGGWGGAGEAEPRERKTETERDLSEQLSLFAPISSVPLDEHGREIQEARLYANEIEDDGAIPDFAPELVDAPALAAPVPMPEPEPAPPTPPKTSALARRRQLREANALVVRDLVHLTGRTHATLNLELNRKVGIKQVGQATVRQLEQRLAAAKALLSKRR
jgi:hypothetical protein